MSGHVELPSRSGSIDDFHPHTHEMFSGFESVLWEDVRPAELPRSAPPFRTAFAPVLDVQQLAAPGMKPVKRLRDMLDAARIAPLTPEKRRLVLDAVLRGPQDWREDVAHIAGDRPAAQQRRLAARLNRAAIAACPNRMSGDRKTVTMFGATFHRQEKLGTGLWGETFRYVDQHSGAVCVMKSLMAEYAHEYRAVIAEEIAMHRAMMGPDEQGNPHLIQFHGAAISGDDTLHLMMEEAPGGDLNGFSTTLNRLSAWGVLPQTARAAVIRTICRDATLGVAALHAAGGMHLDIKPHNFLLDAQGRVKIADYGSTQLQPAENEVFTGPVRVTRELRPRTGESVTAKFDVFLLAEMFAVLTSGRSYDAELARCDSDLGATRGTGAGTAFAAVRDRMLSPDPADRPDPLQLLDAPFLDVNADVDPALVRPLIVAVSAFGRAVGRYASADATAAPSIAILRHQPDVAEAVGRIVELSRGLCGS